MIEHAHPRIRTSSRRGVARDTLIILNSALIAVAVAQIASGGALFGPTPSTTSLESEVVVGGDSLPPGVTLPPLATLGQVVNGSAGLDATPTPIPIITLGPPTPTPSASESPKASPKPTPKPTPKSTPVPTPPPSPPDPAFTCSVLALVLNCTQTDAANTTGWDWDWGDGNHTATGPSASHTYADGCYAVSLTASGPGGSVAAPPQYFAIGATGSCP